MTDRAWKRHERAIAKRLGGARTGPMGKNLPDISGIPWAVECKERKTLPKWLLDAMEQAERNAVDKSALVILHQFGDRHDRDLVVMKLKTFEILVEVLIVDG